MRLAVVPMTLEDIPQVLDVDRESYSTPWPASAYRREILHNRNGRYVVLRELREGSPPAAAHEASRSRLPFPFVRRHTKQDQESSPILGYAGMWLMVDEAHITTIAVRDAWRGRGFGELLLASLMESAGEIGAARVTLEVRVSNETAQNLYRKYGFSQEGVRPRYYSDDNEDAYVMTTGDIRTVEYRRTFERLVAKLRQRLEAESGLVTSAPGLIGSDSSGESPEPS